MAEYWRTISDCDGLYEVSNLGNVKSLRTGRNLAQVPNSQGYLRVYLTNSAGAAKRHFVHRLVARAFVINNNIFENDVVNHKDFNPQNNTANNLEWVTRQGNIDYSIAHGRFIRTEQWKANLKSALNKVMAKPVIGTNIKTGSVVRYDALNDSKEDGFEPSCVSQCCNGKHKTHAGYSWRFA